MKLEEIFKTLGLPLGLVGVIVGLLAWAGLTVEQLAKVAAGLIGFQLLGSFLIDALKYTGVIRAGDSGKWSAAYNLLTLIGVAVWLGYFPSFDLQGFDNQVYELAKLLGLIFSYITQLIGTKGIHVNASRIGVAYSFPTG